MNNVICNTLTNVIFYIQHIRRYNINYIDIIEYGDIPIKKLEAIS